MVEELLWLGQTREELWNSYSASDAIQMAAYQMAMLKTLCNQAFQSMWV